MKAVVRSRYGPPEVPQVRDVKRPVPKKNQLCIQIHAFALNACDCIVRVLKISGWRWALKPPGSMR
jgi:NADPH:quinone reductase-like Zn-dependent oxidoreductase